MPGFDPLRLLRTLEAYGVEFVLIGGFAGTLYGSELITGDIDVSYERSPENLERMTAALVDLEATLRGVDDPVPFRLGAQTLAEGDAYTFTTRLGPLDILGVPAGTEGFDDLRATATMMDLGGFQVAVADLEDLIRMKKAAGRPKDLAAVEHLGALRDVIDGIDEG